MIIIDKWGGLATNASPYAVPPGAAIEQVNLQCIRPGQIEGRPGLTAIDIGSQQIGSLAVSVHRINGTPERVLVKDSLGRLYLIILEPTAPKPPASVTLSAAPQSPGGVTLSVAPQSPGGVTLATVPQSPSSVALAIAPQSPSSVGLLSAPSGLTVTT